MKRQNWFMTCVLAIVCVAVSGLAEVPRHLVLGQKERQTVDFEERVKSAQTRTSGVVNLRGVGEQLLDITAIAPGSTTIDYSLRSGQSGAISVVVEGGANKVLEAIADSLKRQFQDVMGTEVRIIEALDKVEVGGKVRTIRDRDAYLRISERAKAEYGKNVSFSADVVINTTEIEKAFMLLLREFSVQDPIVTANAMGTSVSLRGSVLSESTKQKLDSAAVRLVKELGLGDLTADISKIQVSDAQIKTQMTFFTYRESMLQDVGSDLLNQMGFNVAGSIRSGTGMSPQYGLEVDLDLSKVFNFFKDTGHIVGLEDVTVVSANGKPGRVLFGTELILNYEGDNSSGTDSRDTGSSVEVVPSMISEDRALLALLHRLVRFKKLRLEAM